MLQKIATVLYIAIQCFFAACAVAVISRSSSSMTFSSAATFLVAYYVLGASSWRILGVIFLSKDPRDKKGALDL